MNLPNKLTMIRMGLVPVFLFLLMFPYEPVSLFGRQAALCVFIIASVTDWLDGYIARKYNLVTDFGKFMDPLADKLLCTSAMIALTDARGAVVTLPLIVVIIIIAREFVITGFRTLAVEKGTVIAASKWGKLKTVSQMIMIILLLLNIDSGFMKALTVLFIALSAVLTVISGADYLMKNKSVLRG